MASDVINLGTPSVAPRVRIPNTFPRRPRCGSARLQPRVGTARTRVARRNNSRGGVSRHGGER